MEVDMNTSFLSRYGLSLALGLAVIGGGASLAIADDWSAPNYTPNDTATAASAELQAMGQNQQQQAVPNSAYYNFPGGSWSSGQYGPWDSTDAAAAELKDLATNPMAGNSAQ
jgi:hypothetical protein